MATAGFIARLSESKRSKDRVAAAWHEWQAEQGANMQTDGQTIYSYRHKIGYTTPDGKKIAICCHYSMTTAHHCSPVKAVADEVLECPEHGRGCNQPDTSGVVLWS